MRILATLMLIVALPACCSSPQPEPCGHEEQLRRMSVLKAELLEVRIRLRQSEERVEQLTYLEKALDAEPRQLIEAYRQTRQTLKEKETLLALIPEHTLSELIAGKGPPVPAIDARVAAVKTDVQPTLVLLSVGSEDKVQKGFHFSVYRETEFIGKVVVEKVLEDSCGCRVLFTKEGASIQPGDSAATRLQ